LLGERPPRRRGGGRRLPRAPLRDQEEERAGALGSPRPPPPAASPSAGALEGLGARARPGLALAPLVHREGGGELSVPHLLHLPLRDDRARVAAREGADDPRPHRA